ncbi:MAG TPA: regulatory protein RecX [Malonomonas sp.]
MATSTSSGADPFAAALRLLTGRDRSEAELRDKLKQFGFSAEAIATAIEKCREYNYLDDRRYALERSRAMLRSGRGVGIKILLELRRRGIDEATATAALETAAAEFDSEQLLRDQLQLRFPGFCYVTADAKQRRRVVSFFQRRGFSLELIFNLLRNPPA